MKRMLVLGWVGWCGVWVGAGAELAPPTNETVLVSMGIARVAGYDSHGLQLCVGGSYPPKVPVAEFSEADLRALLETVKLYDMLTSFQKGRSRTAGSAAFEARLRELWSAERSFHNRIQTRLEILGLMGRYSAAAQAYADIANLASAYGSQAAAAGQAAADAQARQEEVLERTRERLKEANSKRLSPMGVFEEGQYYGGYGYAAGQTEAAEKAAALAESRVAPAERAVAGRLQACQVWAAQLVKYGITVASSPPFTVIPPLSVRGEVDAERTASPLVAPVATPAGSKVLAGRPAASGAGDAGFLEQRAAEGSADAQFALAIHYIYGSGGVAKDVEKAKGLLKAAAAQGNAVAKRRLEELEHK